MDISDGFPYLRDEVGTRVCVGGGANAAQVGLSGDFVEGDVFGTRLRSPESMKDGVVLWYIKVESATLSTISKNFHAIIIF